MELNYFYNVIIWFCHLQADIIQSFAVFINESSDDLSGQRFLLLVENLRNHAAA
jgi:hypothetical protein